MQDVRFTVLRFNLLRSLLRTITDLAYGLQQLVRHLFLLRRGLCNALYLRYELRGNFLRTAHLLPGCLRLFGTFHHLLDRAVHRVDGFVCFLLDVTHQCGNLLCRVTRAFRQPLNLFRHHREASAGFTGHSRLHGRIQRQHVGTLRDGINQIHDTANLLRTFAQALDAFFRFGNGSADGFHAAHGIAYRAQGVVGNLRRLLGRPVALRGHFSHAVHGLYRALQRRGHLLHALALALGRLRYRFGLLLHIARHLRHLARNIGYAVQYARCFRGQLVDRVRHRANNVFGHRRLHGQIPLGQGVYRLQHVNYRVVQALVLVFRPFLLRGTLGNRQAREAAAQIHQQTNQSETRHHQGQEQIQRIPLGILRRSQSALQPRFHQHRELVQRPGYRQNTRSIFFVI